MKDEVYLVVNRNGVTAMRKGRPALEAGEYAVRVQLSVPDAVFERAFPLAQVEVSEDAFGPPGSRVLVLPPPPVNVSCHECGAEPADVTPTGEATVRGDGRPSFEYRCAMGPHVFWHVLDQPAQVAEMEVARG